MDDRREHVEYILRSEFEQSLQQRIDRYLSANHQPILGNHHFAHASTECVHLYRDGYFIACITLSQSVAEGIIRFVRDRNGLPQVEKESKQQLAVRLHDSGVISSAFAQALGRIHRSFRDDFHHMNAKVAEVELEPLAQRNIGDLAVIEREIFECSVANGTIVPKNARYWDAKPDGDVPVFLRLA